MQTHLISKVIITVRLLNNVTLLLFDFISSSFGSLLWDRTSLTLVLRFCRAAFPL